MARAFLDTVHAAAGCAACHGGNPDAADKAAAHSGLTARPSRQPEAACGACHAREVERAKTSLHFTAGGEASVLRRRAGDAWQRVEPIFQRACQSCHASCGDCHVSKAAAGRGGLLDGHRFLERPPMVDACGTCHGGRVAPEYLGRNDGFPPDVHRERGMDCVSCHPADQMHGDGTAYPDRHAVRNKARCVSCHPGARAADSAIEQHAVHGDRVNCVVCHATVYKGCDTCHLGEGAKSALQFKIGRSSRPDAPYRYTLLRHVPTMRTMLDAKVKDALPSYDAVPTWKDTSPHNIQRKTARNASCNNCHGNARLFLKPGDVNPAEAAANATVAVPEIPVRRQ